MGETQQVSLESRMPAQGLTRQELISSLLFQLCAWQLRAWQAADEMGTRGAEAEVAGSAWRLPQLPSGHITLDRPLNPGAQVSLSVTWGVGSLPCQGCGNAEIRYAHSLSRRPASVVGGTPVG